MFSSSPPRRDAIYHSSTRDLMCGESAPLIFPCSARSLLSVRSPSGAGKMGEQLFRKPLWADHSASPPGGGENGVYRVYRPLSGNWPMLLDMQKVRFNITGNLVLLLMLTHLTKIQVGMPSSLPFQKLLTYLPLVMLTDPTS